MQQAVWEWFWLPPVNGAFWLFAAETAKDERPVARRRTLNRNGQALLMHAQTDITDM